MTTTTVEPKEQTNRHGQTRWQPQLPTGEVLGHATPNNERTWEKNPDKPVLYLSKWQARQVARNAMMQAAANV